MHKKVMKNWWKKKRGKKTKRYLQYSSLDLMTEFCLWVNVLSVV